MKKWTKILLIIVIVILLLFMGMSYFIGMQVFMGSTQLVTCEDTSKVKDSFWERYNMDYDVFCSTYTIEKVEITSTFDEHMIPMYRGHSIQSRQASRRFPPLSP